MNVNATRDFIASMPAPDAVEQAFARMCGWLSETPVDAPVLLAQQSRRHFLGTFLAAALYRRPVIACDWQWARSEWLAVGACVPGGAAPWWQAGGAAAQGAAPGAAPGAGWIGLPTGGSGGRVRFAVHTLTTLAAAVEGYRGFFASDQLNGVCVLPLFHVGGLMQAMRAWLTGGRLLLADFKGMERGEFPDLPPGGHTHLSLVPTQLERLLKVPGAAAYLRCFDAVLLGGAPAREALLEQARKQEIPVAPAYGMTETAAAIAIQHPSNFLAGKPLAATPLPHVSVRIADDEDEIYVSAASLFHGYWPDSARANACFGTRDAGALDAAGRLRVYGRLDRVMISGGKKVFAEEVERALLETGLVSEAAVIGLPDVQWGTKVVACVSGVADLSGLAASLREKIAPHKQPKAWHPFASLPRNALGKINYRQLEKLCG